MCLIVDSNVIATLFDKDNIKHQDFKPVFNWITSGKGKLVYGGNKIKKEYSKLVSYLKILQLLDSYRKIVHLDDDSVDAWQRKLEAKEKSAGFNDAHILAMVIVSKVKIVCTSDEKSIKYLKNKQFYPPGFRKPKIYSKASHANLLIDKNIAAICKPCTKAPKKIFDPL